MIDLLIGTFSGILFGVFIGFIIAGIITAHLQQR